jgi:hypothetical protein
VADGWCWFVLREEYCWLIAGGWFVLSEKYCWLVADKSSEQGDSPMMDIFFVFFFGITVVLCVIFFCWIDIANELA